MKKIVLVGLINDTNIGDIVIYDNTKYLVEKALKDLAINDVLIESIDMTGESEKDKSNDSSDNKKVSKLRKIINKMVNPKLKNKIIYLLNKNKKINAEPLIQYYEQHIKDAQLVIFVGGGLIKYLYQDLDKYISLIIDVCDKYKVDVLFNSVGIEGYSEKDVRCQRLKKSLNKNCVKMITTRDDIDLLKNHYIKNKNIFLKKVADPAVWTYQTYEKNISKEKSNKIGLGVIRPGSFKDNGINFSEEKQLKLWNDIIKELESNGYDWQLFTNGLYNDYKFGKKILEYMSIQDEERLVDMPKDGKELINIISQYKGIIAARMNANIIAYSLDVPSCRNCME